jgi:hypothetical protein
MSGDMPFSWCDYFRPSANIPLFSERMKGWLDSTGVDNIDYYKVTVTNTKTGETRPYHAANIIGQIVGMDTEKSDYDLFDDDSYLAEDIRTLVLDESTFFNMKICRLAEYDLLVIAHQDLKSVMGAENAQGVEFIEPE